uniref:Uncharacterized protein n=1 Tax=Musa acuminata subsp. malaccensis TaxID=214687 RepID=A0A804JBJ7_MUSAM|nr:PREDICTED: oligopeptide transporter 5-like isoform X2 [Musa acuminata subsp. malaccensis]
MADEEGSSILDDSPIEQVRLTVPPTDDNTLQVLTFRTWLIGIPICILGSVSAALSFYRQQMFYFSHVCINMMVFIAGKLMANMLPNKVIRMPYTNWSFSLNPGPFNLKEHVATTMLAGRVSASAGFEILTISKIYHKDIPLLPAILLVLSIQFLGYGFAGIFMKLLVHSPYMWWPSTLVDVAFYRFDMERFSLGPKRFDQQRSTCALPPSARSRMRARYSSPAIVVLRLGRRSSSTGLPSTGRHSGRIIP